MNIKNNKPLSIPLLAMLIVAYIILYCYLLITMISGIFIPINMFVITFFSDSKLSLNVVDYGYFLFPLIIIIVNYLLLRRQLKTKNKSLNNSYLSLNIAIIIAFMFISEIKGWLLVPDEVLSMIGKNIERAFYNTWENYIADYILIILMIIICPVYLDRLRRYIMDRKAQAAKTTKKNK